jgi:hypothetical protein
VRKLVIIAALALDARYAQVARLAKMFLGSRKTAVGTPNAASREVASDDGVEAGEDLGCGRPRVDLPGTRVFAFGLGLRANVRA